MVYLVAVIDWHSEAVLSWKISNNMDSTLTMDGKGRATDNICIEPFWRSAKVERIYLNEYNTIKELKTDVSDYINFYNHKRFHQTLSYKKPMSFYYDSLKINNKDYDKLVKIGA